MKAVGPRRNLLVAVVTLIAAAALAPRGVKVVWPSPRPPLVVRGATPRGVRPRKGFVSQRWTDRVR